MSVEQFQLTVDYEWKELKCLGVTPAIRYNSSAFVYERNMWVVFGSGAGVGRAAEVWKFDLVKCKWSLVQCTGDIPEGREGHSCSYFGNGKVIVFGGQGFPYSNEGKMDKLTETLKVKTFCVREVFNNLYEFDCNTCRWTALTVEGAAIPLGRRSHTANIVTINSRLLDHIAEPAPRTRGSRRHERTGERIEHPTQEKVLLVFAGSGVEPSKYTEILYNDLWAYSFHRGRWIKLSPKGITPRPTFAHRTELIGDQTLVVIGGMTGMEAHYRHLQYENIGDILILNLQTLTWSVVEVHDERDRVIRLPLHGHSVVSKWQDGSNTNATLYIYGGKEVPDVRGGTIQQYERGTRKNKQRRPRPCFWSLDLRSCVLKPFDTKGTFSPEARYGHIAVASYSSELIAKDPPKKVDEPPAAAKGPQGVMSRLKMATSRKEYENYEEPVMYLFGGCYVDDSGYCDPVVFQLTKLHIYQMVEMTVPGEGDGKDAEGPAAVTVQNAPSAARSSTKSVASASEIMTHRSMYSSTKSEYSPGRDRGADMTLQSGGTDGGFSPKMTIWERKYSQMRADMINFGNPDGLSSLKMKQPETWDELRTAISYPLHERDGSIHEEESPGRHGGRNGSPSRFHGGGGGFGSPARMSPLRHAGSMSLLSGAGGTSSGYGGAGFSSDPNLSPTSKDKLASDLEAERKARIAAITTAIEPMLKSKQSIVQTKEEYLRKQPPLYLFEEMEMKYGSLSPLIRNSNASPMRSSQSLPNL